MAVFGWDAREGWAAHCMHLGCGGEGVRSRCARVGAAGCRLKGLWAGGRLAGFALDDMRLDADVLRQLLGVIDTVLSHELL